MDEVEASSNVGDLESSVLDEILSVESGSKPGLDGTSDDGGRQKKEVQSTELPITATFS